MTTTNYSNFRLLNQRLLSSTFKVNTDFQPQDEPINLNIENELSSSIKMEERIASLILELSIFENSEKSQSPFSIKMEIEGIFTWESEEEYNSNDIDNFLDVNGVSILFSYLRPFVTQFVVSAGFPPLILPIIDFSTLEAK